MPPRRRLDERLAQAQPGPLRRPPSLVPVLFGHTICDRKVTAKVESSRHQSIFQNPGVLHNHFCGQGRLELGHESEQAVVRILVTNRSRHFQA